MHSTTDLITTRQAAELLSVSVATVHRHETEGRLPAAHKIDGLRGPKLFRRSDVEALLTPSEEAK